MSNAGAQCEVRQTASKAEAGLRVCMLLESYHPVVGGMETQARSLARALTARGVELSIVTRRMSRDMPAHERIDDVPVWRLAPVGQNSRLRWPLLLTSIPHLIRRRKQYDILFVPGFRVLGIAATLVSRLLRKACILKADSRGEMSGEFFQGGLERMKIGSASLIARAFIAARNRLLLKAQAFVSIYREMTEEFITCGAPPERVHLIPNMVDAGAFRPVSADEKRELRQRLNLPETHRLVLSVGRLVSYKGLPLLLRAWKRICAQETDTTLVIAGSGGVDIYNCETELHRYVDANDLSERVVFTGEIRNANEYMQACDILAFPTENDAFPLTLIEAMACGLPVITTPVGGIKDAVANEDNALVVQPGDEEEFLQALNRLLSDGELRERLGRAATKTVLQRYTADMVADAYVRLFTTLTPVTTLPGDRAPSSPCNAPSP